MSTTSAMLLFAVLVHSGLRCAASPTKRQLDDEGSSISPTTLAAEFMTHYLSTVADESGKPRNLAEGPTSVICVLDYDIVQQQYRERIPTNRKCTSRSNFVFSLESLLDQASTHQEDITGRIRAYADIREHSFQDTVQVNLSITMNVYDDYTQLLAKNHTRNVTGAPQTLVITNVTESGWQFIEVTAALQTIWPLTESTIAEFDIILEVDCSSQKKMPMRFENAAEVLLEQIARRNRLLKKQPLFIVYIKDRNILEMLELEKELAEVGEDTEMIKDITEGEEQEQERRRRIVDESFGCKIENFTVNFIDLQIPSILSPRSVNINRCSGLCSLSALRINRDIAANHGKIMASARAIYNTLNETEKATIFPVEPQDPCCVPIAYSPVYLLLEKNQAYDLSVFPNFVAEKCACR